MVEVVSVVQVRSEKFRLIMSPGMVVTSNGAGMVVFAMFTVITDGVVIWRIDPAAKKAATSSTRVRRLGPKRRPRQRATREAVKPFHESKLSCKAATVCPM